MALAESVIGGLLVNGLTALFAHIAGKAEDVRLEKELRKVLKDDTVLTPILEEVTKGTDEASTREKLRSYLASPDAEAITRQVYSSLLTTKSKTHLQAARSEFVASLSLHLDEDEQRIKGLAEQLFDTLVQGCNNVLKTSVENGFISKKDLRVAKRHGLILDELQVIRKNLSILTGASRPNVRAILEFEQRYRSQVGARHAHITPPHFDAARRVPIVDLYVTPNFARSESAARAARQLKGQEFLRAAYRAVVLGNPGGGKSTFVEKLCHDLAVGYSKRLLGGRQVTPILVVLREYGVDKKTNNCSILQFIEATANSRYQVKLLPGAFEYLLLNGRAVVIFDGLDELLETSYRQEISGDVESFCNLYPSVPVLVTSREVGYEQAPLDENRFEIFRLSAFDDDQIEEYAKKWFSLDDELTDKEKAKKTATFLDESRPVADLRSNPLMLALMCNIYRGENYIPRNRPDVYEKCAVMLFERWDKSRGIFVQLPFEAHINPAIKYLAHEIYANDSLQAGVTEHELIRKTAEYLASWRFEDRDEAEKAAREFIEFCRGRAWVFTDTGTTREGERLYQFTHRTFLEYFTAGHLVRIYPTPESLAPLLLPRIAKREWDVVAQLAFQLQNKNVEGAGDKLLADVMKRTNNSPPDTEWNLLSFAARCLEFMVPRPAIMRHITEQCLEHALAWGLKQNGRKKSESSIPDSATPGEVIGDLLDAAVENRSLIADSFEKLLVKRANSDDARESLLALEIGLHTNIALHRRTGARHAQGDVQDFWAGMSNRVFEVCSDLIVELSGKHLRACLDALRKDKVSLTGSVRSHGPKILFANRSFTIFPEVWGISIALSLVTNVLWRPAFDEDPEHDERTLRQLEEAGHVLLGSPPPWVPEDFFGQGAFGSFGHDIFYKSRFVREREKKLLTHLNSDALFGVFVLLAPYLEQIEEGRRWSGPIQEDAFTVLGPLRHIFAARSTKEPRGSLQVDLDSRGFTTDQRNLAVRWARRKVSFVRRRVRRVSSR